MWGAVSSGLTLVLLTLLLAAPAQAAPLPGSAYDSGDGDQADGLGLDWQAAIASGAARLANDLNDDCFVGGTKELTPNQWAFSSSPGGCTPGKSNVRVGAVNSEPTAATTFGHFAFFRNDTTGNSFLTFELNQTAATWTNATGATIPCRTNGDLLLSVEVGGSTMGTSLYRWTGDGTGPAGCPNGANGTFTGSGAIPGTQFQGAMNTSAAITNYIDPAGFGATFPANAFGEVAIDLPAVLNNMGASPCFAFVQMQIHSRSSSSISSAMIDYTAPVPAYLQSCAVMGTQYEDTDGDGTRDGGEPGLAGFRAYLDLDDDGTWDAAEPSGVSDATGFYRITDVPAGTFKVRRAPQSGWTCSQPAPCEYTRSFATSSNSTGNDFGNRAPSTASGVAFDDSDGDGVRDAGEPGLPGVTVFADLDADGVLDAGEQSATSDANGAWTVSGIPAGTYAIRPVTPAARTCSVPVPCSSTHAFVSGTAVTGIVLGSWAGGTIAGTVTESGAGAVAGAQVFLDADGDDTWDLGEAQTTTAGSGAYSLTPLAPGPYTVRVTLPSASWYFAGAAEHAVALTSGVTAGGRDFTLARYATVSGTTWDDADGDGIGPEAGEAGLPGFTVWVDYDGDNAIDAGEPSAISGAGGAYTITGVLAGTWTLRQAPNGAYECTQPVPCTYSVVLASDGTSTGRSFGNFVSRTVSGTVFNDSDADGAAREAGEAGLAGWVVYSDADNDSVHDAGEPVATTNSLGVYSLAGLANGSYRIRIVAQAAWTCSSPVGCLNTGSIGSGQSDTGKNFGVWGPSTVSGTVSEDTDADGDADAPVSGRTVYADLDNDSTHDGGEPSTTTNASGAYAITGLNPGTYTIRQVLPGGWTCSSPSPCSHTVATATSTLTGRDFASWTGGSISGAVEEDADADGTGDSPLAGRTVFLDGDADGTLDGGEPTQVTDGAGAYAFGGLTPGAYSVRQVLPAGWTQSSPAAGHAVTVTSGSSAGGRDFAAWTTGAIAGTTYEDLDFDGAAREGGEPGLAGRVVYVDADDDGVKDAGEPEAAADGSGDYSLTGLRPGDYVVRPVLPADWACAYPASCSAPATVSSGATTGANDFGSYVGADVSGTVFEDLDGDGQPREGGEPGAAGQRVYLDADDDAIRDDDEPTALTGASGDYDFDGITAETWQVRLELSGWTCDSPSPCRADVLLSSGADSSGHDFGIHTSGSIAGHLFTDRDADGQPQVFGENDQPGRTVFLDADADGDLDGGETSTTTDGSGDYAFGGVAPGTYEVRQVLPAGWTCSRPVPCVASVTVTSGEDETGHDFSSWTTASFTGVYFEDTDADGLFPEPGEPALGGRTVYLDLDDDGVRDGGEPETTTAGDGTFTFAGLLPGAYVARSETQPAWTCSYPSPCVSGMTLEAGEAAQNVDFGEWTTATVSGTVTRQGGGALAGRTVYADADDDGEHDAGEPSDLTDASGAWSLDLDPGDHVIRHVLPAGWTCESPSPCDHAITLASQQVVAGLDFADVPPPATLSGTIFEDVDGDGTRDAGEPGAPGQVVEVGAQTATTAADGTYSIGGIAAGDHTASVSPAAGWQCSGGCSADLALADGDAATFDAPVWRPSTISGSVVDDADGSPLENVTVTLDGGAATATTDAAGAYSFAGLPPGDHDVDVTVPAGWSCERPDPCTTTVTATSDSTPTATEFGLVLVTADLRTTVALPPSAGVTEVVDLLVEVTNAGPFDAANVAVAITLPPELTVDGTLPAGCSAAAQVITCDAGTVADGGSAAWTIPVRVADDARDPLTVEAEATADTPDPTPADATDADDLLPVPSADVLVEADTEPRRVPEGYQYEITIRNDGPSTATGVILVDGPFPDGTIVSAVTDKGTCAVQPDGSLRCELGDLADGEEVHIVIVIDLDEGADPLDTALDPTVSAVEDDPTPANNNREMELPPAPPPPPAPAPEPDPQPEPEPEPQPQPEPRIELSPVVVEPAQVRHGGCLSSRNFPVKVRRYRSLRLRRVTMTLAGRPLMVTRRHGRFVARVDLRGRPPGRYVLRIRAVTKTGGVIVRTRTYTTCADTRPYWTPPL